jgi:hypothetical protein
MMFGVAGTQDGHPALEVATVFGVVKMAFSETPDFHSEVVTFDNHWVMKKPRFVKPGLFVPY